MRQKGNDIPGILDEHPAIHTILLNGIGKTIEYFKRFNQFNPSYLLSWVPFHGINDTL